MEVDVSFAMSCKEEAASASRSPLGVRALLSGFAKGAGSLRISGGREELSLSTESATIAKMLYTRLSEDFSAFCRFAYTRGVGFRKKVKYHVLVSDPERILNALGVDFLSPLVPEFVSNEEARAAYLAGAFLAGGSVNNPESSNYHLEIAVGDENYAKKLSRLFGKVQSAHFESKIVARRKEWVVYLKKSATISEFLVLIGATNCCLEFEGVRVDRDAMNIDNRLGNLDAANMSKTNKAAERQLKEIAYFQSHGGMSAIANLKLRALMELRLAHPDASLEELAELLSEELASSVSKSNVNHLFRSLHNLYLEEGGDAA